MEQIRQILSQLALHLELNIAMCDMIDDHEKRLKKLEISHDAQKTRIDMAHRMISEQRYAASSMAYDKRKRSASGKKTGDVETSPDGSDAALKD